MDLGFEDGNMCNGNDLSSVVVSKVGMERGEVKDMERVSLLCSALKKGRRQRSRRKKVRWNDCNGNKLVEVVEFQPSDSSDSEEEYHSTGSIWFNAFTRFMLVCCCFRMQR